MRHLHVRPNRWFHDSGRCTVRLPTAALAASGLRRRGGPLRRTMVGALVLAALGILGLAAPVAAFPLTNCTLAASSIAADGSTIASIASGAADATQDAPFLVDWDGTVTYKGSAQVEMKSNKWHVDVFGVPTPLMGGSDNGDDNRDGSGTVGVSANAPFRFTGLYYVSGVLKGSGGTCEGSGWFKLTGDPTGTLPFSVAAAFTILGVLMLARGAQGHTITSIVGGLFAGVGVAALLVLYSTLPLGYPTPLVVLLAGVVLGILIALVGRRSHGDSDAPPPPSDVAPNPPAPPPPTSTPPEEPTPA